MVEEKKKDTIQLSIRDFPANINTRMKKLSVRRGTSLRALVIEACAQMLQRKPK